MVRSSGLALNDADEAGQRDGGAHEHGADVGDGVHVAD
jgi:hypothetical protein